MSTLIIYYSLTGHVKKFVEKLKEETNFESFEITTKSTFQYKGPLKFIAGGFQSISGSNPAINDFNLNLDDYDRFIFISPVWAEGYAAPFNSFLTKYDFANKEIIIGVSCMGSHKSAIKKFKTKLPMSKIIDTFVIYDKKFEENDLVIKSLKKY